MKLNYDVRKILNECDAAEISTIIDDINLLVMEHINDELVIAIKCLPHQRACLEKLHFNVDLSFAKIESTSVDTVCYHFAREQ